MINFRFHLVSLIAVFLALALGVVVGSTVIDRAIVDGLEAQIERVERNADQQRERNSVLGREKSALEDLARDTAPFAVAGRLDDVTVAVVAVRGTDHDAVEASVEVLRTAGARVPAVLWLEEAWALPDQQTRRAIREVLNEADETAPRIRTRALELLAQRIGGVTPAVPETTTTSAPPRRGTTTRPAPDAPTDPLEALVRAGFVTVDPQGGGEVSVEDFPGAEPRVVVLSGADEVVPASFLVVPFVRALDTVPLPSLVGDPGDGAVEDDSPPTGVGLVRNDDALADRVATVDSLMEVSARIALVLALEELGGGVVGHYGTGPGASGSLPPFPER
jgi:hypothetical protein